MNEIFTKEEHNAFLIPGLCYDILKFIQGDGSHKFDEAMKNEIEFIRDPDTGEKTDKLRFLTDPDLYFLSDSGIDRAIEKYGNLESNDLIEECHDKIYQSVKNLGDEITATDMIMILCTDQEFAKQVS
jgi:hypothetical protein